MGTIKKIAIFIGVIIVGAGVLIGLSESAQPNVNRDGLDLLVNSWENHLALCEFISSAADVTQYAIDMQLLQESTALDASIYGMTPEYHDKLSALEAEVIACAENKQRQFGP